MGRYEITGGKVPHAKKVVVYGVEGVGKTTFASKFPNPLFIDTEGSTKNIDVRRMPAPTSWPMLLDEVMDVVQSRSCGTLVIDTADWAEKLCVSNLCTAKGWNGIEDPSYGIGYRYAYEEFGKLLNELEMVVSAGIHVVVNCHSIITKFEQPDEMGSYDRYQLKLIDSKKCSIANMVKEWADMVLFANFQTIVVQNKEKKTKGQGGTKRVMYTTRTAAWDAKNREGLLDVMDFDFNQIAHLFPNMNTTIDMEQGHHSIQTPTAEPQMFDMADGLNEEPPRIVEPENLPPLQEEPQSSEQINWNEPVYQTIPLPLLDLMKANNIPEWLIRKVSSKYFPEDTPIANYPADYIQHIMDCKDEFVQLAKNYINLPF